VTYRNQAVCAWCGPLMMLLFFIGLFPIGHFIWPPAPSLSADEIAAWFAHDTVGKRIGLFIAMLGTGLLAPFYAVISAQMRPSLDVDDAMQAYRQQSFWPYTAWAFTIGRAFYHSHMQPVDACLAVLHRTATAIEDLDAFAALDM